MNPNLNISVLNRSHQDPAKFSPISRFESDCQNAIALGCKCVRSVLDLNAILKGPGEPIDDTWVKKGCETLSRYGLSLLLVVDPRFAVKGAWPDLLKGQSSRPLNLHPAWWPYLRAAIKEAVGLAVASGVPLRVQLLNEAGQGGNQDFLFSSTWDAPGTWGYWQHRWLDEFLSEDWKGVEFVMPSLEAASSETLRREIDTAYRIRPQWASHPLIVAASANCHARAPISTSWRAKADFLKELEDITGLPVILTEAGISPLGLDPTIKSLSDGWEERLGTAQLELFQNVASYDREVFFFSSTDQSDVPDVNVKGLCRRDGTRGPGFYAIWSSLHPAPAPPEKIAYRTAESHTPPG